MGKKEKLLAILSEIFTCNSEEGFMKIYDNNSTLRMDRDKYPLLNFKIGKDEINILKNDGIITDENILANNISDLNHLSALEKLLYALIWKQGELVKLRSVISGIIGLQTDSGLVFNQFGRYLSSNDEVIIDQHTIRAYIYYKTNIIIKTINNQHYVNYTEEYKNCIVNNKILSKNKIQVDELLFAIGKELKNI
jgi:hypothetical protein